MNDVYFGCRSCREAIDAGYRWAYATLEAPGIVRRGAQLSANAVLSASEYWAAPLDEVNPGLPTRLLPAARSFLQAHVLHDLQYGDWFELTGPEPGATLDWLDRSTVPTPTLRYFTEVVGVGSWRAVLAWVKTHREPWWWRVDDIKDPVRMRIEALTQGRITTG